MTRFGPNLKKNTNHGSDFFLNGQHKLVDCFVKDSEIYSEAFPKQSTYSSWLTVQEKV